MSYRSYSNFVRGSVAGRNYVVQKSLTGEEAKRIYLQEVKEVAYPKPTNEIEYPSRKIIKVNQSEPQNISTKDLLLSAQNNDVDTMKIILDKFPDKINMLDEFGWSLLMIACQADSIECVKELLKKGIDTSTRDKAGNSAATLVLKNKNVTLADILLNHNSRLKPAVVNRKSHMKVKLKDYYCDICYKTCPDKNLHLASTIHNINASKGRKIPSNFKIPGTNKGYQLMLKEGWDEESGLGPEGSGKKYPIKTVQKIDRKGLGHKKEKRKTEIVEESKKHFNLIAAQGYSNEQNRQMEIRFRREFY